MSQEVATTPPKITRDGLFLDYLPTINHMLEKYEYEIFYSKQNYNNCEGARALQPPFIRTGESG